MNRHSLSVLLLLLFAAAPASAQDDGYSELYYAVDAVLRTDAQYADDRIALELVRGTTVTVRSETTRMNVDTGEILEVLGQDRYRVRTGAGSIDMTGAELRSLNLPHSMPDGTRVLAGPTRETGSIARVDRANDPALRAFLDKAAVIGSMPISDNEKLARLTKLVNQNIKYAVPDVEEWSRRYPSHPRDGFIQDSQFNVVNDRNRGDEVNFGRFLEIQSGVCRTKALAMKLALERIGIPSRYVAGEALVPGTTEVRAGHAWVEAITSDGRLFVDPTARVYDIPLEKAYRTGDSRRPVVSEVVAKRIFLPGEALPRVAARDMTGFFVSPDMIEPYRRADGTLRWKSMARDGVFKQAGGVGQFALALFLKELAVVAKTGDRARIEEFFEALLTFDFYLNYGLFVGGARLADVAYSRYLQRYVKPGFVGSLLRTNLTLAAGLMLPQLIAGQLDGKAFAISLGALGLSVTAVKAGMEGIAWVTKLKKILPAGRVARIGGWIYSVAELAVILYFAEVVEETINRELEAAEARAELVSAQVTFLESSARPGVTGEELVAAAQMHHAAWNDYREFLYRPLEHAEMKYMARMMKLADRAKRQADSRVAMLERLETTRSLRASVLRRFESVEAYADHLLANDEAELAAKIETYVVSYSSARAQALRDVYEASRRDGPYVVPRNLEGLFESLSVDGVLQRRLEQLSSNKLQTYRDEADLVEALAAQLLDRGDTKLANALSGPLAARAQLELADMALYRSAFGQARRDGLARQLSSQ